MCLQTCFNRYRGYISMDAWGWNMINDDRIYWRTRARSREFTRHDAAYIHHTFARPSHRSRNYIAARGLTSNFELHYRTHVDYFARNLAPLRAQTYTQRVPTYVWYYPETFARAVIVVPWTMASHTGRPRKNKGEILKTKQCLFRRATFNLR